MTPFYRKALDLFARTQSAQIAKGLQKYPEPFNPHSWSPDELLNHALEETVDLTHYLVGLKELLDAKDKELDKYKNRCREYERKLNEKDKEINRLINRVDFISRLHDFLKTTPIQTTTGVDFPKTPQKAPYTINEPPVIRYSSQDDQY